MFESWSGYHLFKNLRPAFFLSKARAPNLPRLIYASGSMLMSAFPKSGRSDRQKLSEIDVRFRPKADVTKRLK